MYGNESISSSGFGVEDWTERPGSEGVVSRIKSVEAQAAKLDALVGQLRERLQPALRSEPQRVMPTDDDGGVKASDGRSEVADRLASIERDLRRTQTVVVALTEAVDL